MDPKREVRVNFPFLQERPTSAGTYSEPHLTEPHLTWGKGQISRISANIRLADTTIVGKRAGQLQGADCVSSVSHSDYYYTEDASGSARVP